MFHRPTYLTAICACLALLVVGCAKTYVITQELAAPIGSPSKCFVSEIEDHLPLDQGPEDRPTIEDMNKLRNYLVEELTKKGELNMISESLEHADYQVRGSVLSFRRGSGFLRFMIGFGVGNSGITVHLELVDFKAGKVIFGGNFTETVSSGFESGSEAYKRVAKKFAKELDKQHWKLMKE